MKTNDLTRQIIYLLKMSGYHAWRNNNGAVFDPKKRVFRKNPSTLLGVPDILAFNKTTGKFLCVEVKGTKSDKLSKEQVEFIEIAKKAGCIAIEARNIDDVLAVVGG